MSVLKDKNILLGVSGGIAAYKSITLLRLLKKNEAIEVYEYLDPIVQQTLLFKY